MAPGPLPSSMIAMSSLNTLTSALLITLLTSSFTYEDPRDDIGLTG